MRGMTILSLAGALLIAMAGLSVSAGEASGQEALSLREEPVPSRQQTGIFPPDPPDAWRIVTQVGGTSDCIGDPVTPMCAVDSYFACTLREDNDFCARMVENFAKKFSLYRKSLYPNYQSYWKYRVVRVLRFYRRPGQRPPRGEPPPREMIIELEEKTCTDNNNCGSLEPNEYIFVKLLESGKWIVTGVYRDRL